MKKLFVLSLIIAIITLFAGCAANTDESTASVSASQASETTQVQTITSDVKDQIDQILKRAEFNGMVQITRGNDVIYQYVSGNDDNEKPLTIDSSLPLASVSKQFCAASIMKLFDENKISLDDTLEKYYPEYKNGKDITIKDLLTMSSGVPEFQAIIDPSMLGDNEEENLEIIKNMLFEEELDFEPGERYAYSNSNYTLLSGIVEQISGESYHDFLRKNFFEPLEMTHTGFVEEITENGEWADALSKTELMLETTTPGVARGCGDVVSNAADMDKWMHGISSGKVISADAFKQMTSNPNPHSNNGYSYGLWQMPFGGMGHVGQIAPHYGAVDYLNTDKDVFLFAASNTMSGVSYVEQLPYAVLSVLFENE